jgi:DNA polymerase (family X)
MENREIARMLSETGDLMEIAEEDSFRIRSYRNAASVIEGYPERIAAIAIDSERKLTDIPGIGKGIAFVIQELLVRGSFERRDEMLAKYPPTALELLKIQGLGPKSIRLLFEHFRVSTIDDLERIAKEQKIRTLPRMGAKLEEKVLRSIEQYRKSAGRFLLNFAAQTADDVRSALLAVPGVSGVTPAGSLRRGRETIGDIDLIVTGPDAARALDAFVAYPKVQEVLGKGPNKASARIGLEGVQVDVRALPEISFGAAMQYFTGSKEHNINIRMRAQKRGLTLNEYGLVRVADNQLMASATEEDVYAALGLAWIPPELRENQGEIEAAESGTLPKLIELSDIRGDIHMHTRETDGRATLEEMAAEAKSLGHEYVAITDHSKALAMANGLDEARVVAFAKQIRERNRDGGLGIRIFSGLECDIRRDGTMDIENDALAELDFVIGSVHSYLNLEPAEMTDRLLKALECPSLRALGHPTGRLLLHRDAFSFDFERIANEAVKRGVAFEINASPERLDLPAPLIRVAKSKGARFTIATDAHHPKHLHNMRYGVTMARRGWLTKDDVLNTRSAEDFAEAIKYS